MAAGTSEHGMTGNTPGKSENAVTHMMSRSYPSAKPVWLGFPTTARSTFLRQASVDGEKPQPQGFALGNRSLMSRCLGIMQNQPLINLQP